MEMTDPMAMVDARELAMLSERRERMLLPQSN
jgi:hypothetical protein